MIKPQSKVTVDELTYSKTLASRLKALFDQSSSNDCFIKYSWFDAWLHSLSTPPKMLFICKDKKDIGAVFFCQQRLINAASLPAIFNVNKSPSEDENQVWIEFNSVICDQKVRNECINAIFYYLLNRATWFGIQIQMAASRDEWLTHHNYCNKFFCEVETVKGFKKTLRNNQNFESFLQSFSSGVRSEFNRSQRKALVNMGELKLEFATEQNIGRFFDDLSELHKRKWRETSDGSGFTNEKFLLHHRKLIKDHQSSIRLLRLCAGDFILGYQYYLVHKKKAYFYCAGLETENIHKHIKPGLMFHLLAMYDFSKEGFEEYDYLGGDANYKKRLSDTEYNYYNIRMLKKSPIGVLLNTALQCKNMLTKLLSKPSPDSHQQ